MQSVHGGLPYDCMNSCTIIDIGKYVVMMINTFPPKRGLSHKYSSRTSMRGNRLEFKKQSRCPFRSYIQPHDDRNVSNLMVDRIQGAICLCPTGNLQGPYKFLSICTGRNIIWSKFTELPTTPRVTQRLINMDMHEKQQKFLLLKDYNGL